jgi:Tol biopolymer transport system component
MSHLPLAGRLALLLIPLAAALAGCSGSRTAAGRTDYDPAADSLRYPGEVHLRNVRQLTFGGNNAEAYWRFDDEQIIFQSDWAAINPQGCDQQFVMAVAPGTDYDLVSTGQGRTTCGYFLPDGRLIYASTHAAGPACPTPVSSTMGRYVWSIFPEYDIYVADADGANPEVLIGGPGYDAEATVSPDGRFVVFTSTRDGDLDLYRYEMATGEIVRLTNTLGYDGGAFFSPDSRRIVWRASRPTGEEAERYQTLLAEHAVEPSSLNLFVAEADGANARQVTDLPGANWAPFFHPSGENILFASNHHALGGPGGGREFALFLVNVDGTGLEQVTHSGTFDAFPMFSFAGDRLVFASNRRADRQMSRETNIFVADWVEEPEAVDLQFQAPSPGRE